VYSVAHPGNLLFAKGFGFGRAGIFTESIRIYAMVFSVRKQIRRKPEPENEELKAES
jgi:hypothetical protein